MDIEKKNIDCEKIKNDLADFYKLTEKQKESLLNDTEMSLKKDTFLHSNEYYREKIFNKWNDTVIDELDLEVELCKTKEQRDIWNYLKIITTSAHTSEKTIKEFKLMLKDKKTNKYLGLINLSPELFSMKARDDFIGWTHENKKESIHIKDDLIQPRLSFLVNIQCCIGLQPIAHNLNIGKLLVAIVFSKEVLELYKEKYGYYYAGVTTLSLYGKSIQYDRLKEIRYIGETKGYGLSQLPHSIILDIINYVKVYYPEKFLYFHNKGILNKLRLIHFFIRENDCLKEYILHNQRRGIYFGYTGKDNHDFFQGKKNIFTLDKTRSFKEVVEWWKERWARPRFLHLKKENRIKICFEFKDLTYEEKKNEYNRQYQFTKYHTDEEFRQNLLIKKKEKYLEDKSSGDENYHQIVAIEQRRTIHFSDIIEIMLWKKKYIANEKFIDGKMISKRKVAEHLSSELNKKITDIMVKKYWNGDSKLNKYEFDKNESKLHYEEYLSLLEK